MNARILTSCAAILAAGLVGAQDSAPEGTPNGGAGPVRLARISFADGNVSWRPDDSGSWSQATPNLPLQQGAQIWVAGRGRAEIQFDDGSNIRLGNDAIITLQSLYSDAQGEFTEIKQNEGTASLHLKDKYSIYQIDTPFESVKAAGPARFRVDVGNNVSVGVRTGSATVTAAGGDTSLRSGDYVVLQNASDSVRVRDLPREDAWDRFDDDRDAEVIGGVEHLPPNIAIVAGGIGRHGHWHLEGSYGWVWGPSVGGSWRPYHDGHWVWVNPFGWTWCGDESWGWAPYHYGTWAHFGWGWGWCPGPYHQYWSPATVSFTLYNGSYCWVPLCPEEVYYPDAFGIGFFGGDWWFNFSIGFCGVYRPGFHDAFVFGRRDFGRHDWGNRFEEVGRFGVANNHFVPRNAAFGASAVSEEGFGHGGRFRSINGRANQYFERGQGVTSASHAFSGPVTALANKASMTPTHTFNSSERPASLNRALYRAPVSSTVARSGEPFGRTINPGTSRSAGRSGTYTPGASRNSGVESARRSLGYVGRDSGAGLSTREYHNSSTYNRSGDRYSAGSTANSRGVERSVGGAGTVERARQSLGYSGSSNSASRGSSRDSAGSRSSSRYAGSSTSSSYRGSSYGSRYHSDSQSSSSGGSRSSGSGGSSRSSSSGGGSRSGGGGYSGGSSRGGGGSRDDNGSRGGGGGGGGNGRGGH